MIPVQEKELVRMFLSAAKFSMCITDKAESYVIDTGVDITHPEFQGRK